MILFLLQKSCPTSEGNETQQFIEQLKIFLNGQGKNVSLKYDHKLDSVCCSGDILSIQLLCKCEDDYNKNDNADNNLSEMSISYDVSILFLF